VEWSTLEKDWRWNEGGLMGSAGGLHGLHVDWRWTPRGSMGECKIQVGWPFENLRWVRVFGQNLELSCWGSISGRLAI
jgi:hypothetical protein